MSTVSANELKTQGVSALEQCISQYNEALITVRGVGKYVVMPIDAYQRLREAELDAAIAEARSDHNAGKSHTSSVREHIKRISKHGL